MPRLVPAVVAAVLAVLLASACTPDKPGPNYSSVTPTPSSSTPPTPTESPSPTGIPSTGPNVNPGETSPTKPAGADAGSAEGAQAFEAYYIKLIDWVYATSEPKILEPFYASTCTNCANFATNLAAQVANGSTFRGSRISIQRLALVSNDGRSGAQFAVSVEIAATALEILDSGGQVTDEGPASTLTLTNWLRWSDDSWLIVDQGKA